MQEDHRKCRVPTPVCCWLFCWLLSLGLASAAQPEVYLETHCFRCHGNKKAKGGLNLIALLEQRPLVKNRERWNHVIDLVKEGEMPPEDERQLTPEEEAQLLQGLDVALNHFDFSGLDEPGFELARRLTNQEYNRTVSDLFGVPQSPADRFPSELTGESGFDNSANTLFLQTSLMERYIAAAERVVENALPLDGASGKFPAVGIQKVFGDLKTLPSRPEESAERILSRFLLRAYRRPPSALELEQSLSLFRHAFDAGEGVMGFVSAVRKVIQATLVSPKFLLKTEAGNDSRGPFRISDYELASRLSYFLWATMPDDELFAVAGGGRLHDPKVLAQQVDRMLRHPYADTLGNTFAAQWLGFRFMGSRVRLDPIDNPWCTDSLMTAMREESALFFTSLIRDKRSLEDLLTANYTYMNEELAGEIYGMEGVSGSEMRRVILEDPNRGGILTHGSLMAITSNYKDTSPIKRGNWILETVLGRPLPPPPPNAGAFNEEVEEDDSLTFREKVELHSSNPSCRTCHSKIDPLGFSLENFDYFGRWRDGYRVRVLERVDEEVFDLVMAVRALARNELEERMAALDSGPKQRQRLRLQLQEWRAFVDEESIEREIHAMTPADQMRLIRDLEDLEVELFDEEVFEWVNQGLRSLRDLTPVEVDERILKIDDDDDFRREIRTFVWELRSLTERQLNDEVSDAGFEELDEMLAWLDRLRLFEEEPGEDELLEEEEPLDEEIEEDEHEEREFEYRSITGAATLPDGTPFAGPVGLRSVLLQKHKGDLARQLVSKMLAYALGRQLEYYDEPAIRKILTQFEQADFRLSAAITAVVNSYPFQFKKNPAESHETD